MPAGVDAEQLQKIAPKIQKISADGTLQQAATNIQKSAKQDCNITLN